MMLRLRRKKETEEFLLNIKEKYRGFFKVYDRIKSKDRRVAVIDHTQYESFLRALSSDGDVRADVKVLLFVIISSGLKISEALNLQRASFESENGTLYFYSRVKSKKKFIERKSIIHPAIASLVEEHLLKFRAFDKIFSVDRHQALYAIKKALGESLDLHSLRHAHISYLLFEKQFSLIEVEALVKLNPSTVRLYAHTDPTNLLNSLYIAKPTEKSSYG